MRVGSFLPGILILDSYAVCPVLDEDGGGAVASVLARAEDGGVATSEGRVGSLAVVEEEADKTGTLGTRSPGVSASSHFLLCDLGLRLFCSEPQFPHL